MQLDDRVLLTSHPNRPDAGTFLSGRLLWFAAATAVLLAFFPLLTQHARQVWDRPHYRFAPFAIFAAILLAKFRLREVEGSETGKRLWTAVSISAAWILLAAAVLFNSPRFAAIVFLLMLASAAYSWRGKKGHVKSTAPLLLMALTIPFPFGLDWETNLSMQALVTSLASKFLDALGIFHVLAGDVFESMGKRLLVEDASTGINALFPSLAATLAYSIWRGRSAFHTAVLTALAFPVVLITNALQVTLVCYLAIRYQFDLTLGVKHQFLGYVSFLTGLLLILSTDNLIRFLFAPISQPVRTGGSKVVYVLLQSSSRRPGMAQPILVALGFGILAAVQCNTYLPDIGRPEFPQPVTLGVLVEESLPAQWDRWSRTGFEAADRHVGSSYGPHSRTWIYTLGESRSTLSLDYPFPVWHEIEPNYTLQGWLVIGRNRLPVEGATFSEVLFSKPGHRLGHLFYAEYDNRCEFLVPPEPGFHESLRRHSATWDRLKARFGREVARDSTPPLSVYQVQLFTESSKTLSHEERSQLLLLLRHGTNLFQRTVTGSEP